jgi:hypothetical protein
MGLVPELMCRMQPGIEFLSITQFHQDSGNLTAKVWDEVSTEIFDIGLFVCGNSGRAF